MFALSVTSNADSVLKITEKNLMLIREDKACFFAKIENAGKDSVYVDKGSLACFDSNDEIIVSNGYINSVPRDILLAPGESVYVHEDIWDKAVANGIADYKCSFKNKEYGDKYNKFECTSELDLNEDPYYNFVNVTYSNKEGKPLENFVLSVAVYDQKDNLVFVGSDYIDRLKVHPESTVTYSFRLSSELVEFFAKEGIKPTKSVASVYEFVKE